MTTEDRQENLRALLQETVRNEDGHDEILVTKGIAVIEVVFPDGTRTYWKLGIGDCRTYEARGLMAETLSDFDAMNAVHWDSLAQEGDDDEPDTD